MQIISKKINVKATNNFYIRYVFYLITIVSDAWFLESIWIQNILLNIDTTLVCKKNAPCAKKNAPMCKKNAPPRFGVFKKILNNKNNLLVKVKFMKK